MKYPYFCENCFFVILVYNGTIWRRCILLLYPEHLDNRAASFDGQGNHRVVSEVDEGNDRVDVEIRR